LRGLWWEGSDGSLWDLVNGPVQLREGGLKGLMRGPVEVRTRSWGNRNGQEVTGSRALPRFPALPVVWAGTDSPEEWESIYRAWSHSFDEVKPGKLRYLSHTDEVLSLSCRLDEAPDNYDDDWAARGYFMGTWDLVADDPFWYLPTVSREFASAVVTPRNFYGGGPVTEYGRGYPLVRGAGVQAGRVQIENPGSEPANWVARFPAPSASFLVSIGGMQVSGSYAVPGGGVLEISSATQSFYLLRNGVRTVLPWSDFDRFEFAKLPPGTSSEVFITSTGDGVPSFTFDPRRKEAM